MSVRRMFAGALVAISTNLAGCAATPVASSAGSIELVIFDGTHTTAPGSLTLSRNAGAERWQLPLHARLEQTRRLSLPAGLYALDHTPDVSHALLDPTSLEPETLQQPEGLPRWVVVAPGRVTHVTVRIDEEQVVTRSAETALVRLPLN